MSRHIKKIIIASSVFMAIIVVVLVFILNRGSGTEVKPVSVLPCDNVISYYQRDDMWKEDSLGNSKYKMSDSGCLTSCIASLLNMQNIDNENPKELNSLFSQKGVYDEEGNIQWDNLESCLNVSVTKEKTMSGKEIQNLIEKGIYPIVRVRVNGIGAYHYVLLVGCEEDSFLCMDSLNKKGEVVPLSKFKDTIYAVRYIVKEA